MKPAITRVILAGGAVLIFIAASNGRAQQNVTGSALNFTTTEYYNEATNHLPQVKSRLTGDKATRQPDGRLVIKQLQLETFDPGGKPVIIITAPECVYDPDQGTASSPGPLHLQNGDGKFRVEGEGFLWRQTNSFLTISNQVRTVIENGAMMNTKP